MSDVVKFKAAWYNDAGEKKDEDSKFIKACDDIFVIAVADGVGGLHRGEIASRYITRSIENWFAQIAAQLNGMSVTDMALEMENTVIRIHEELLDYAEEHKVRCGSTLTFAMVGREQYLIIHVGDSRAYIYDNDSNKVKQITVDQTVAQYERETGDIIEAVAPERKESVIIQCLGTGEIEPMIYIGKLPKNFDILLCTDGLSNTLAEEDLIKELNTGVSGKTALKHLTKLARERGESDNITSVMIRRRYNRP